MILFRKEWSSLKKLMFLAGSALAGGWRTVTGAIASFVATKVTALSMEFDLVPIQAGTGDPSPDNIRPITGHDGFTRNGTGKNLLDIDALISAPSGEISSYTFKHVLVLKLEPNTKYTLSTSYSDTRLVLYFDGSRQDDAVRSVTPVTKTSSATGELTIGLYDRTGIGKFENKEVTVQLEKGESVTSYQEFGHTYTTTFPTPPGTVYGGHVTDNGDGTYDLTVDRIYFTPTTVGSVGTSSTGVKYISKSLDVNAKAEASLTAEKNISSEYRFRKNASPDSGWFRVSGGSTLFIYDNRFTDKETAESILESEKPQFVYELAEPQTYTLSLTALQSLIGQNHIWVDNADSVSVEYWGH